MMGWNKDALLTMAFVAVVMGVVWLLMEVEGKGVW
jgi:hypothetical protein